MGDSRKLDASQRQELAWLLDEADSAVQSWWQAEQVSWHDILTTLVSRLRLCGFDLEAEGIASDVQAAPKIGRKGCRNHRDLMQLRQQVVDRVRKRIVAIRKVMADKPQRPKRRRRKADAKKLTPKQAEAVEAYAYFNGDIPKAAKRCGISPRAMRDRLEGAWTKIGERPIRNAMKAKARRLTTDKRGQEVVFSNDETEDFDE